MNPLNFISFILLAGLNSALGSGLAELAKMAGLDVKELGLSDQSSSSSSPKSSTFDCGGCGNCPNCNKTASSGSSNFGPSAYGDFGGYPMASAAYGYSADGGNFGAFGALQSMGSSMGSNLIPTMNGFGGGFGGYGASLPMPYTAASGLMSRFEPSGAYGVGPVARSARGSYNDEEDDAPRSGYSRQYMGSADQVRSAYGGSMGGRSYGGDREYERDSAPRGGSYDRGYDYEQ